MTDYDKAIADLAARVTALENASKQAEPVGDALLAKFAGDIVKKTPKQWTGASFEGKRFDQLAPDEAQALASFYAWCAKKGAAEVPVRVGTNGKPFHERDALLARVLAAFAAKASSTPF